MLDVESWKQRESRGAQDQVALLEPSELFALVIYPSLDFWEKGVDWVWKDNLIGISSRVPEV